jgi:hypothetical protein
MRIIGVLATAGVVGVGLAAAGLALVSLPDIKRYVRMSRM